MANQYRLVGVGNADLVAGLSKLVQQSNALTAQVLAHLVELDDRKLHLELGFSSLFAYCVEALGMSEGTAGRRVTATRVCRRFTGAFEHVARGQLHLCALCALAPHLNDQNAAELFEASKRKTRRQIEELLAVRFPRPDVREQIRRLPARGQGLTRLAIPEERNESVKQTLQPSRMFEEPRDLRDSTKQLQTDPQRGVEPAAGPPQMPELPADSNPQRAVLGDRGQAEPMVTGPRRRDVEPLSANRFGVHFTADAQLRDLIERARALASHRIPKGDLAGLMKLALARFVNQEEKRRFGIGTTPRRSDREAKAPTRSAAPPGRAAQVSAASPGGAAQVSAASPGGAAQVSAAGDGVPVPSCAPEGARSSAGPTTRRLRSRYLLMQVRREIYARDGGQCAFVSLDGRRCSARAFVEFDHLEPFARNGSSDAPNLRLLCKNHNLLHARACFGSTLIAAKIAARGRRDRGQQPR